MEILKYKTVHIKDRNEVEKKLQQLIKGGASKLQVISDFDGTLSRAYKDGVRCDSTYCVLDNSPFMSEDYKNQSKYFMDYYHPKEIDPHLTKAEKTLYMVEWFNKSRDLLAISGLLKDQVPEMIKTSSICLREGCDLVFESLNKNNVPLLIFSAGLGDILKEVLAQQDLLLPNMKIVANFMQFDEKNKLTGFKGNLIHTFNKNQSSMENSDYFSTLKSRNNIILLGDTLGDLDMSEGVENADVILKIGFLNQRIQDSLSDYLNSYDIVLTDDHTMVVVNELLKNILN